MKNKLRNLHQRSLVLVLLTLLAFAPGMKGWGQQVIGSFPSMDGGFENQTGTLANAISISVVQTAWTTQVATTGVVSNTGGRSGPKYVAYTQSGTSHKRLQSPTADVPVGSYVIQFYYQGDMDGTIGADIRGAISCNGTANPAYGAYTNDPNTGTNWTLYTAIVSPGTYIANLGVGIVSVNNTGLFNIDDFVIYAGSAIDATAPDSPGVVTVNNPTQTSLDVSWVAAAGGVDGGGYVVVRYSSDPGTGNDPNQNGIYAIDNTIATGGTVRYIGTNTSFTDNSGLIAGTQYWYKVYTVDKAFNYSVESSGNGITAGGSTPLISVSVNSLTGFTYVEGNGPSEELNFTISGTNLSTDISIVPPTDYEISTGTGVAFSPTNPIPLTQTGGTVDLTTIYVRLKAGLLANTYNGEVITASSSGATNATVTCDGSVIPASIPVITLNPLSLSGFTAISGTVSASQNYTVSGDNLTVDVTVTAPSKYEVSTDDVTFTPSVSLPQSGGNIVGEPKTVYVRIAATAPGGTANGDVAHTSTNAATVNLAVTGNVYLPEPSNHASAFVATATGFSSINITWSDNDGTQPASGFLILANTTGTFTDPVDGVPQTDDVVLSDGSGVKNVVHGAQSYTWTGLLPSTPYYFVIYAYTNSGTYINYKVIPAAPAANVTTPAYVEPLAAWTFDGTPVAPNTPTSIAANVGTQLTATFYADGTNGSSLWSTTELNAFTGTTLNDPRITPDLSMAIAFVNMSANGKSVVFKYSMIGYIDPVLTFAVRGTASGFNTHTWEWSTDNITYTPFGSNTADNTTNFVLKTLDMSAINGLDQAATVYLKLTLSGATTATGNNRLDNVVLHATSATVTTPTVQAHDITFGSVLANSMTVNWTNGDGAKRIVIMNTTNSFTDPVDGTDPAANTVYGGSGEQVVYNNSGSSVPVTGLITSTTYWFRVYEYNGGGTLTKYLTTTANLNPSSQITSPPAAVAPTIINPVSSVITDNSALLGGDITNDGGATISERGTVWNTITGVTIDDNKLAEGGLSIGIFSHTRSPLPAKTHIFFKAYATNSEGTTLTTEASFFTLASEPTSHVAGFTATAAGTSSIDLAWTAPATGADGYLILKRTGADAPTGTPADATAYSIGTAIGDGTVAADVLPGTTLLHTIAGLSQSTQYSFTIIPYAYDGSNYQTYNYYTAATIPSATATTDTPPAGILVYDGFDYPVGEYIGGNGAAGSTSNNWTTHNVSTGQTTTVDIITGNLSFPGLTAPTGNKVNFFSNNNATSRDVNRAIPSNTNTVMYFSALVNVLDNTQLPLSPDYFMHFGQTAGTAVTVFGGRLGIKSVNTAANYRLSILNTSGGTTAYTEYAQDLNFGTTYLVVVKYDIGTSPTTAYLWVDPVSLGGAEPSGFVSNTSGTNAFSAFASICLRNSATTPKAEIDEIRVGSTWADVTPAAVTSKTLSLKLYLEGLYTGGGMMIEANGAGYVPQFGPGIADQVTVELHDATSPYAISSLYSPYSNVDLNTDGTLAINSIPGSITGSYYVVIKHRNSIETWSGTPVSFDVANPNWDFSTAASQAVGDNMRLIGSVYAIWGGDVNQDGVVDTGDMNNVENESSMFTEGYVPEDANGDGIVDTSDMNIVENNSTAFIQVVTP